MNITQNKKNIKNFCSLNNNLYLYTVINNKGGIKFKKSTDLKVCVFFKKSNKLICLLKIKHYL